METFGYSVYIYCLKKANSQQLKAKSQKNVSLPPENEEEWQR